ncbi:TaqI-like C-terminal specificity domain-containing protein, partial [Phocaeicola paurosaccharolyticus]|uniref:TaqI-like C-terminal specificity domain-containing protein n=1 Tax=Phocaeicola paurosaccharolyticus TaxID=732242 RepID=UPI00046979DC
PDISQNLSFSIDANGYFIGNTAYFMSAINLEYLLHILNSKLIDWYYRTLSVQLGEKAVRMFSIYVLKLPIPLWLNTELQNAIKSEEPSNDINRMVYEIYNLDNKEMEFIEFQ